MANTRPQTRIDWGDIAIWASNASGLCGRFKALWALAMKRLLNLLFICARNQWRSPTGETIYRRDPRVKVRSAGLANSSRRKLKIDDLVWADIILVMSEEQSSRVKKLLRKTPNAAALHSLDIPDEYRYMDPELIDILIEKVDAILET